jgi:hypothetical protein
MIRSGRICSTDSPFRAAPENGVQHVGGDDRRAAAVVSLAGCGGESFEGGVADVLAFGLGHRGEEREQDHPAPTDSQPRNLPSHIRPIFGGYYGDPVSGRGAGEQLRSSLFQGCHLGPQAVQFAIYLRKRRLRLSFLQVVAPTCCLDECLNLRSEKAQPGIAVDGTLSVLQLAVADRLDDLVLSESELGASSLVAQGGALASPLGFEAVDDSPLPRNGLGNGAAGDDMVSDCAGCVQSGTNRARLMRPGPGRSGG